MTESHAPGSVPRPGLILAVLLVSGSVFPIVQSLVLPALPIFQRELDTTPAGVTWIFTAPLLAAAVVTPIAGRLGDMFGKKRVMLFVLATITVGTLMGAVVATLPLMVFARAAQGVGAAFFPLAYGIIRDEFPRDRVAPGIGLLSGVLGIGGGLGIILAGPILANFEYHWLFWFPLVVLIPALFLTIVVVPESPVRVPGHVDVVGGILLSSWLVLLLVAISEAPRWGWLSLQTTSLAVFAIVVAIAWIAVETKVRNPLVDMQMMQLRDVWSANLATFLIGFAVFGSILLIPQFVQTPPSTGYGFGASVTQAGLIVLPASVMTLVGAALAGRVDGLVGPKVTLVLGTTITLLSLVLLTVAHSEQWLYLATLLLGLGFGLAFSSLANLIVESVGPDQTGVATGMNTVMRMIGGAVGSQVAATILAAGLKHHDHPGESWYTLGFAVMGAVLFSAVVAALVIPGRERRTVGHITVVEAQVSID